MGNFVTMIMSSENKVNFIIKCFKSLIKTFLNIFFKLYFIYVKYYLNVFYEISLLLKIFCSEIINKKVI